MSNKVKELTNVQTPSDLFRFFALIVIGIFRGVLQAFIRSIPMRFTHRYLFYSLCMLDDHWGEGPQLSGS